MCPLIFCWANQVQNKMIASNPPIHPEQLTTLNNCMEPISRHFIQFLFWLSKRITLLSKYNAELMIYSAKNIYNCMVSISRHFRQFIFWLSKWITLLSKYNAEQMICSVNNIYKTYNIIFCLIKQNTSTKKYNWHNCVH